jgi:multisubunit Na+/H+ antiporter MnhE subunit
MGISDSKILGISILLGIAVTFITGFFPSTPSQLIGSAWYGYPKSWLIQSILAPQYNPWRFLTANFVIDFLFWSVLIAIISLVARYIGKREQRNKAKARKGRDKNF